MTVNNDLKIKITGTLNTGLSIKEINTAIKGIEKKISKLKINIEINDKTLLTLSNFNKQMQKISQSAKDTGKVIESALLPDGTRVTRTFFDGMNKEFQQTIDNVKRVKKEMQQTTGNVDGQIKSVKDLTAEYSRLTKEAIRYNKDGSIQGKTATYLNDKGNARVIKTDAQDNVIAHQDLKNYENLIKAQNNARQSLQELAKSGKYTTEELRKIGQGINLASTIKQIDQLKTRMSNMKFGNSIRQEQESLIQGFKRLYDQGKIGQSTFDKFNNSIKGSKNLKELDKLQQRLQLVTSSANNKQLQQKLISDAQTLLRTHSKTVDTYGVNKLITDLNRIPVSARNASNALAQAQTQIRNLQQSAREASRSSMTILDAFRTAMVNFAVYCGNTVDYEWGKSVKAKLLIN